MTWLKTYKKTVITAGIGFIIPFLIFMSILLHNAWGDERYEKLGDAIRSEIQQIDNKLFDIGQEVIFATTDQEKLKWAASKEYYENLKEAFQEKLEDSG